MRDVTRVTTLACSLLVLACTADRAADMGSDLDPNGEGDDEGGDDSSDDSQGPRQDDDSGDDGEDEDDRGGKDASTGNEDPDSGTGGGPKTSCTGKPGAPGLTMRQINGHNVQVYVPKKADPNKAAPLLLVHHGFLLDGEAMRTATGYEAIAEREGFAVAFPDGLNNGLGNTWNAGTGLCGGADLVAGKDDDLTFVREMISSIEADQCISREHVFMTGFSMGGFFSNHAGCQLGGDLIRGIAPSSSGSYEGTCPGKPIPVMFWHGTLDSTVPSSCSPSARDLWVKRNGCKSTFDTVSIKGGKCEWQHGCPAGAQVVLCMVDGMNHQWSGGTGLIGAPNSENASEMIWKFFKDQHGL